MNPRWTGFRSRFVYRPAALWLGWSFIASVVSVMFIVVFAYQTWDQLRPSQDWMISMVPYLLAALLPAAFGIVYSGLQYTVAKGMTVVLGDAGVYHVNQLTPLSVTETVEEYDSLDDPDLRSDPQYIGKVVRRHKIHLWGRNGGVKNWPGWDGGKRDGYWDVVYDFWDEIEGVKLVILKQCPRCAGSGQIDTRGTVYTEDQKRMLKNVTPGLRLGTSMVLPYEAWPLRFDEIHEDLAMAIHDDPEWRLSSMVWSLENPIFYSIGTAMPSNTLVTSWARERTNRALRDRLLEVSLQMSMIKGMYEEGVSQSVGPPQGFGSGLIRQ